jgi:hypothetical protein
MRRRLRWLPLIPLPRPSPRKRGEGEDANLLLGIRRQPAARPLPHIPSPRLRGEGAGRRMRGGAFPHVVVLMIKTRRMGGCWVVHAAKPHASGVVSAADRYPLRGMRRRLRWQPLIPLPRPSPRRRGEGEDASSPPDIRRQPAPRPLPYIPSPRLRGEGAGRRMRGGCELAPAIRRQPAPKLCHKPLCPACGEKVPGGGLCAGRSRTFRPWCRRR